MEQLWGGETTKAVDNFQISGERVPAPVVHWLGRIKAAAARTNAELGLLDEDVAERIAAAGDEVAHGRHDDQFPIDVFQTGSGTSSNMNANEVIATLAGEGVHPNDHVNLGQSSNDVFPSAVHLAAARRGERQAATGARPARRLARRQGRGVPGPRQVRTHAPDGRGARHARPGVRRVRRPGAARSRPGCRRRCRGWRRSRSAGRRSAPGSTPTPSSPPACARLTEATRLPVDGPADPFEAQADRDALVELSGALKVVAVSLTKIANDLALMGSGPRAGLAEIFLPELQKGSSIMPGKVNPVIPEVVLQVAAQVIGNDAAITVAGSQGQFELNVRVPLIARNLLQSIALLSNASLALAEKCVDGIEPNREALQRNAESTPAIATALNPYIGYDKGTEIVQEAVASRRTIREVALEKGVDEETLDRALDLEAMTRGVKSAPAG